MKKITSFSPIIIIGDSLPFPRSHPECVEVFESYPAKLQARYEQVFVYSYGGTTSSDILWQAGYFDDLNNNKICILHFGIVDCTPRAFRGIESLVLKLLRVRVPKKLSDFIRRYRRLKRVSPLLFERNCRDIAKLNIGKIIVLPIAPASSEFEKMAPGVTNAIRQYNAIINYVFKERVCPIAFDCATDIMSDGHHLNSNGHEKVFNALVKRIDSHDGNFSDVGICPENLGAS